MVVFTGL